MLKSKKYLGKRTIVDLELDHSGNRTYVSSNGIISHNCEWCSRFYIEDGKPKIYNLKDLIANGSNDGKAKSAWLPVVGKTHFSCRCQLIIIPQ